MNDVHIHSPNVKAALGYFASTMARRDEVLEMAIALLDEVGLDGLTTRELASRLGVQAAALYRHYESKQALLDAMAARILQGGANEAAAGPPPKGWRDQLRAAATELRALMLAHRDGARLLASFRVPSETALAAFRALVASLESAGASSAQATVAVDTVMSFVNGFTLEEQARHGRRKQAAFDAGLDLVLRGIEVTLPDRAPKRRRA